MANIVNTTAATSHANFLETAWHLGARLSRDAIWDGDRCNWLGASMDLAGQNWIVTERTFGPDFYAGTSGVALFLAYLHQFTGEKVFQRTAMGALRQAFSRRESLVEPIRASFYSGLLGVAYARLKVGELFGDEALVESALATVESLMPSPVSPQMLDIISGSAGIISALIDIHRRYPRDFLMELAIRHANNLLATAKRTDKGWSWRTLEIPAHDNLTGFSHGTAGIASAFLELNSVIPDSRYKTAAENAFHYEQQWFDSTRKNWADLRIFDSTPVRKDEPLPCSMAWCHGAPGIALARLRAYELLGNAAWRTEAETAIHTTSAALEQMASAQGNYSLCHGHAGNEDSLLYAAEILDPSYRAVAEAVGNFGISQFDQLDRPWPCGVPNGGEAPGLMLGLAGIGYFYLRLFDSRKVPSVLILRPPSHTKKATQ
jgi:type 2 lantibiotic biosynthesis protein LanM